ncbi:hypothetical protein LEAN103870_05040 [Legionella anisa]|uniref:Uncharacterized protein n=1 Tax=Legionella anisa TaxID=28082 RepID=A0AAX0WQU6_9GAMM|nr:hypothetical protein [Legionella anisa]AWN73140.1 hypothetical protein DLD14_04400 [Legionella anisa]KTC67425.1 hypothetical protein Lani_3770 [Legionella anisa]MBN5936109.1 hypothetical protein [Legionella anisa]MCW8423970.1 hypothetical protein [Legionella anisa]MCW8447492.1 hypothetical protein [Legionella anisa]
MRLKVEIEAELAKARERLKTLEKEFADNDDRGLDRFMFLTSINQLLNGANKTVEDLEKELEQFSESRSTPNMAS